MFKERREAIRLRNHSLLLPTATKYSDMTITYGTSIRPFHLHKIVVCGQSPVIAEALDSPFKEAKTANFHLPTYDRHTVGAAIMYMYGCNYNLPLDETYPVMVNGPETSFLEFNGLHIEDEYPDGGAKYLQAVLIHAKVSCLGAYLDIPTLRDLAIEKLKDTIKTQWFYLENCFPIIIKRIYEMDSDERLHLILIDTCATRIKGLYKLESFKQLSVSPLFHAAVLARSIEKGTLKVSI